MIVPDQTTPPGTLSSGTTFVDMFSCMHEGMDNLLPSLKVHILPSRPFLI